MPLSLAGVDIPASAHPDSPTLPTAFSSQDARQVIFVHQVVLSSLSSALFRSGSGELLLVFGKNQLRSPTTLAAASFPFPIRTAGDRLGNAKSVAAVVPLHVLFQVHGELAVGMRGAGDTGEGVLAAPRTELLVHVFGGQETAVAAFDERLEVLDPLQGRRRKQIQVHLKQNILALENCWWSAS